jgi:hypothetical protein
VKFYDRILHAEKTLEPFRSEYVVAYEDVDQETCSIMIPTPEAMAQLMHGGVFPPVWVYWELAKDEAQPNFERHHRMHLLDETPREDSKTEKEAIEYLIMKDVPQHIWRNYQNSNSVNMKICKRKQLPKSREFRDAWRIAA